MLLIGVFPTLLCCSPVTFADLLKKNLRTLRRGLSITTGVSHPKLCDMYLSACEKLTNKILSDEFHPSDNDLSKCSSHIKTSSTFRPVPSRKCLSSYQTRINHKWFSVKYCHKHQKFTLWSAFFQIRIPMRWRANRSWLKCGYLYMQTSKQYNATQQLVLLLYWTVISGR